MNKRSHQVDNERARQNSSSEAAVLLRLIRLTPKSARTPSCIFSLSRVSIDLCDRAPHLLSKWPWNIRALTDLTRSGNIIYIVRADLEQREGFVDTLPSRFVFDSVTCGRTDN